MERFFFRRFTRRRAILTLAVSAAALSAFAAERMPAALALGAAAAALASGAILRGGRHPRISSGSPLAFLALAAAAAAIYLPANGIARQKITERSFQLDGPLVVFQEPRADWQVSHPRDWVLEVRRMGETVDHVFRPSKVTLPMYFSVTSRPHVGTEDIHVVAEGFLRNWPKNEAMEILESSDTTAREIEGDGIAETAGPGQTSASTAENAEAAGAAGEKGAAEGRVSAYRILGVVRSGLHETKSEILIVLDGTHLYFLSVNAPPAWFDRQRPALEKILHSFRLKRADAARPA